MRGADAIGWHVVILLTLFSLESTFGHGIAPTPTPLPPLSEGGGGGNRFASGSIQTEAAHGINATSPTLQQDWRSAPNETRDSVWSFKRGRKAFSGRTSFAVAIISALSMASTFYDLASEESCKLKDDIPGMDVVQKMDSLVYEADYLDYGHELQNMIMQTGPDGRIYLTVSTKVNKKVTGQRVIMAPQASEDHHLEQNSNKGGIVVKNDPLIIAVGCETFGVQTKPPKSLRTGKLMRSLYSSAQTSGTAFGDFLRRQLNKGAHAKASYYPLTMLSVLFLQPDDDHQWCAKGKEYLYLGPQGCDSTEDVIHAPGNPLNPMEWWLHHANPQAAVPPEVLGVFNLKIHTHHKNYYYGMIMVVLTVALALCAYYFSEQAVNHMVVFGYQMPEINEKEEFLGMHALDWLLIGHIAAPGIVIACLVPIFVGMVRVFDSKAVSTAYVKVFLMFLTFLIPTVSYAIGGVLGSSFEKILASRAQVLNYINQFLSMLFFFHSLIGLSRTYLGMNMLPLFADDMADFILGLVGVLGGAFDFINSAREGHANGGECSFEDLRRQLVQNSLLETFPETRYAFKLQCDVLGGYVSVMNDAKLSLWNFTMSYPKKEMYGDSMSSFGTWDMTDCLLTCVDRVTGIRQASVFQCRNNGIVGSQWYAFTDDACPGPFGTAAATNATNATNATAKVGLAALPPLQPQQQQGK